MHVWSVSIEGSRRSRGLEMCTSSEQHGKWLICYMENPKNWCDQKVKYKVHNSMSCRILHVHVCWAIFYQVAFFKESVRMAKGNEQLSLHVSRHKNYLEKFYIWRHILFTSFFILMYIVLLHLKYHNSLECNKMGTCISLFFVGFGFFSQITSFISLHTLIVLYLFFFLSLCKKMLTSNFSKQLIPILCKDFNSYTVGWKCMSSDIGVMLSDHLPDQV
jgi:hypothetical protein